MFFRFLLLKLLLVFSFISAHAFEVNEHPFKGNHLLASYLDCDQEALENLEALMHTMEEAVEASGAHVLDKSFHTFTPPGELVPTGLTMILLLSESHATIHTYPEYRACFVDIFTCGDTCLPEKFHEVLQVYLKPKKVSKKLLIRHHDIVEKDKA